MSSAAMVDANDDGIEDIVATHPDRGHSLFIGKGDGSFDRDLAPTAFSSLVASDGIIAKLDFNKDGRLDIAVARPGTNQLFRNEGRGHFTLIVGDATAESWGQSPGRVEIAVEAFNADGRTGEEIVTLTAGSAGAALYSDPSGTGNFRRMTAGALDGVTVSGTAAVLLPFDADQDGDNDLFIGDPEGLSSILLNDGSGRFTLSERGLSTGATFAVADAIAVDFDRDGDQDLALANIAGRNVWYRNTGGAVFQPVIDSFHTPDRLNLPSRGQSRILPSFASSVSMAQGRHPLETLYILILTL